MTRSKAFLIHLGISAVIFGVLLYLIVFIWYPQPYFAADGGWQGIRLVGAIDMVLGPLLTLIVFRAGKPGLKLDLTLIALVQAAALSWGVWTIYDQRTAMVTFADNAFFTMNREMVERAGILPQAMLARATTEPVYAIITLPENPAEARAMLKKLGAKSLVLLGEAYQPLGKSGLDKILTRSIDMQQLASQSPEILAELDTFLKKSGGTLEDYAFLPLFCRYADLVLALRRADGEIAGSLDINALGISGRN